MNTQNTATMERTELTPLVSSELLGGVPMLTLKDGSRVPEYMVCKKCGAHLHISPNSKGAFSYQGCNCHEPEWMQYESAS